MKILLINHITIQQYNFQPYLWVTENHLNYLKKNNNKQTKKKKNVGYLKYELTPLPNKKEGYYTFQ